MGIIPSKKGSMWILTALLCIAVLAMMLIVKSSRKAQNPFSTPFVEAGGDTIDVAIQLDPNVYRVVGDSAWGRDYERLMLISKRHNVNFKLHPFVPLTHAMDYLDKGLYDMVVASMPLTSQLRDQFLMTDAVYLDREMLVQLADSAGNAPITSQIQLGGDTVWIAHDSPIEQRIVNLSHEIGDTIYIKSDPQYSSEHLLILVSQGIIKLAVVNEGIAKTMKEVYPQLNIDTPVSFTQFQSWAVNRTDSALLDSINHWLADTK